MKRVQNKKSKLTKKEIFKRLMVALTFSLLTTASISLFWVVLFSFFLENEYNFIIGILITFGIIVTNMLFMNNFDMED